MVSKAMASSILVLHRPQAFVESKDGTTIPMFIVHRVGIQLDGSNPTLLYGYGGELLSVHHLTPKLNIQCHSATVILCQTLLHA